MSYSKFTWAEDSRMVSMRVVGGLEDGQCQFECMTQLGESILHTLVDVSFGNC